EAMEAREQTVASVDWDTEMIDPQTGRIVEQSSAAPVSAAQPPARRLDGPLIMAVTETVGLRDAWAQAIRLVSSPTGIAVAIDSAGPDGRGLDFDEAAAQVNALAADTVLIDAHDPSRTRLAVNPRLAELLRVPEIAEVLRNPELVRLIRSPELAEGDIDPRLDDVLPMLSGLAADPDFAELQAGDVIVAFGAPIVLNAADASDADILGHEHPVEEQPGVVMFVGRPDRQAQLETTAERARSDALRYVTADQLAGLSAEQRDEVFRRAADDRPVPFTASDAGVARTARDAVALARDVPGVETIQHSGSGLFLVTTTGGNEFQVGLTRGTTGEGLLVESRRFPGTRPAFLVTISDEPGVELISGFYDDDVNSGLAIEHAQVLAGGQLAVLARQIDALAEASGLLDAASGALTALVDPLPDDVRAELDSAFAAARTALGSPGEIVELGADAGAELQRIAASALDQAGLAGDHPTVAAMQAVAAAAAGLTAAAATLAALDTLTRASGHHSALSGDDLRAIAELLVRDRLLTEWRQQRSSSALTRWRGIQARQERIAALVGRLGLGADAEAGPELRELLDRLHHGEVVRTADKHASARAARQRDPSTVDQWWIPKTMRGLAAAVGASSIKPTGDEVFRVAHADGAFTVAIALDGTVSPAAARADLVIRLESSTEAESGRWELAGRVGQAVELHRRALDAGIELAAMADRAAEGELGPDLLVLEPWTGSVTDEAKLSPADHGTLSWIRAYRSDYQAASWRRKRELRRAFREFAHDKGLLRPALGASGSPDYQRKLAVVERVDRDLADFIRTVNGARPGMRPAAEPGVDVRMLREARFDAAAVPALVGWLNEQLARSGQDLGVELVDGHLKVTTGGRSLPVDVGTGELFGLSALLDRGPNADSYVVTVDPTTERRRGEQLVVNAIYAVAALAGVESAPAGIDEATTLLALRRRQLAEPLPRSVRSALRSDLRAFGQLLEADPDLDLAALPEELRSFLASAGRGRAGAIDVKDQRFRAQIAAGESAPSRVPQAWPYFRHKLTDFGLIGLMNTTIGLVFGLPMWRAGLATVFAVGQSYALARQGRATDLRNEAADNAQIAAGAAERLQARQAQAAEVSALIESAIRPMLSTLVTDPPPARRAARSDTDLWASRATDPASGRASYKDIFFTGRAWFAWNSGQQIAYYGIATAQTGLMVSGLAAAVAQLFLLPMGEMLRGGYTNRNWNRQRLWDAADVSRAQRLANEATARQLRRGAAAVSGPAGATPSVPAAPAGRRPQDIWASRPVHDHRPWRSLTLIQNVVQKAIGTFAPYGMGALVGALPQVGDPTAAAVLLGNGLVNWLFGSVVSTAYDHMAEQTSDRAAIQQADFSRAASRRATNALVSQFNERVWNAIKATVPEPDEGWPESTPWVPGAALKDFVVPQELESVIPAMWKIGLVTGIAPGIIEGVLVFVLSSLAPVQPMVAGNAAQARGAAGSHREAVEGSPGSWVPGSHHGAELSEKAADLNEAYARAADAATAAAGTPGEARAIQAARAAAALASSVNKAVADFAQFQTLVVGTANAVATSLTGPTASYFYNRRQLGLQADQVVYRVLERIVDTERALVAAFADTERRVAELLAGAPTRPTGHLERDARPMVAPEQVAATLRARVAALKGVAQLDEATAAEFDAYAEQLVAEREQRARARRLLTAGLDEQDRHLRKVRTRLAKAEAKVQELVAAFDNLSEQDAPLSELDEVRSQLDAEQAVVRFWTSQDEHYTAELAAEQGRVRAIEGDLYEHGPLLWKMQNPRGKLGPGVTDERLNGVEPQFGQRGWLIQPDERHQRLLEALVPKGSDGAYLPYSDTEIWGWALNEFLRDLEPGRDINCVATALAQVKTRLARPTVAGARTVDAMTLIGPDVHALGGQVGGLAWAERELDAGFDAVVPAGALRGDPALLGSAYDAMEAHLRNVAAVDGVKHATGLLHYTWSDGSGHVIVVEYDEPTGVRYYDWDQGGRLPGRPTYAPGDIRALEGLFLDGHGTAMPFPQAGSYLDPDRPAVSDVGPSPAPGIRSVDGLFLDDDGNATTLPPTGQLGGATDVRMVPPAFVADTLKYRWEILTRKPPDAATAAEIDEYAREVVAARAARVRAHEELTARQEYLQERVDQARRDLRVALQAFDKTTRYRDALPAEGRAWLDVEVEQHLDVYTEAARTFERAEAALRAEQRQVLDTEIELPDHLWPLFNPSGVPGPGVTDALPEEGARYGRRGWLMRAPGWQQRLLEALVPTDENGRPLMYTDGDSWWQALNWILRDIEPGHDINCVATVAAYVRTRLGQRTVSEARTVDSIVPDKYDVWALGGQVGGPAWLEDQFEARFQKLLGPEQLGGDQSQALARAYDTIEDHLRSVAAVNGEKHATAILAYAWPDRSGGHALVAEYDEAHGVRYRNPDAPSRLVGRPDFPPGAVFAFDALFLGGRGTAMPLPGAGRGYVNARPPTEVYRQNGVDFALWEQELADAARQPPLRPAGMPDGDAGVRMVPIGKVAAALRKKWRAVTGEPLDEATAAELDAYAAQIEAARIDRARAYRALTAQLPSLREQLHDGIRIRAEAQYKADETARRIKQARLSGASPNELIALTNQQHEQQGTAQSWARLVDKFHSVYIHEQLRVAEIEEDIFATDPGLWALSNPGAESGPGVTDDTLREQQPRLGQRGWLMPAPAWQQQLVDKMVPTDADGHPLLYTDAELWGPAFNNVLRRLEPGHDINCVATAAAHVQARLGRPVVYGPRTIDATTMARGDVRALGGQVGGTEWLQGLLDAEFDEVVSPGELAGDDGAKHLSRGYRAVERHLRRLAKQTNGHATAVLAYTWPDRSGGHTIVVEYDEGRGIRYFDWDRGGRLPGRPDIPADAVFALDALFLNGHGTEDRLPGAGPGYVVHAPVRLAGPPDPAAPPEIGELLDVAVRLDELELDTPAATLRLVASADRIDPGAVRVLAGRLAELAGQLAEDASPLRLLLGGPDLLRDRDDDTDRAAARQVADAAAELTALADRLQPPTPGGALVPFDFALEPGRGNWTGLTIQQAITDRGFPGDSVARQQRIDAMGEPADPSIDPYDPTDPNSFLGGDLPGLTEGLDYVRGLGIDALWISPVARTATTLRFLGKASAGHHYYWTIDFLSVDPRQGSLSQLQRFIEAAHTRGIKVILDLALNQLGVINDEQGRFDYRPPTTHPHRDAEGNPVDPRELLDPARYRDIVEYPYEHGYEGRERLSPAWLRKGWALRRSGDFAEEFPESILFCDTFYLAKLFHEHPAVRWGLGDVALHWMLTGFDGFRYDTANHMFTEFFAELNTLLKRAAQQLGRDGFPTFGEAFTQDSRVLAEYVHRGQLDGMIDFPLQAALADFVSGLHPDFAGRLDNETLETVLSGGAGVVGLARTDPDGWAVRALHRVLSADALFTNQWSDALQLLAVLSSHDDAGHLAGDLRHRPGAVEEDLVARVNLGYSLVFTLPRVAGTYGGDEQGQTGRPSRDDPAGLAAGRAPTFAAAEGSPYLAQPLIGTDRTNAEGTADVNHPIYRHIAALSELRRAVPALRDGAHVPRITDNSRVFAFSRVGGTEADPAGFTEHVVLANPTTTPQTVTVPTYTGGLSFVGRFGADGVVTSGADKAIQVVVPPLSLVVYRGAVPVTAPAEAPTVRIDLAPPARFRPPFEKNSDVGDLLALGARVAWGEETDSPAQVSFWMRPVGAPAWGFVGTTDRAPFQVHPYVDRYPPGTQLEIKVVARDVEGRTATDTIIVAAHPQDLPPAPSIESFPPNYALVHYSRPDGDYDGWRMQAEVVDSIAEPVDVPFTAESGYGRFAWVKLHSGAPHVRYRIVHDRNGVDGEGVLATRDGRALWRRSGDATVYASPAEAQGYVTIRRTGTNHQYQGLHLFGGVHESERTVWPDPRPFTGRDLDGSAYARVRIDPADGPVRFSVITDSGGQDGGDRVVTAGAADAWVRPGDDRVFYSQAAARDEVVIRLNVADGRPDDVRLVQWGGEFDDRPMWAPDGRAPTGHDGFGPYWVVRRREGAPEFSFVFRRGGEDITPVETLDLDRTGHVVHRILGAPEVDFHDQPVPFLPTADEPRPALPPLTIVHVSSEYPGVGAGAGGMGTMVVGLAHEQAKAGHIVWVVSRQPFGSDRPTEVVVDQVTDEVAVNVLLVALPDEARTKDQFEAHP
ncbi:MAG TPA: alpha-amylase family glycosyl hydrolase, partial [Jatrophihabitantaceae bacterium]|nr:alpha-amylase family glycosyl hydrolase [Jatrophihabitantaceae bacterium]